MLLYVKDSLKYSPYNFKDRQFEEHLFCEVVTGHSEKILIGSLFRSPSGTDNNFEKLLMGEYPEFSVSVPVNLFV
jgi:hypothetical protein